MSDPGNFLARWSRRKREVAEAEKAEKDAAHADDSEREPSAPQETPAASDAPAPRSGDTAAPQFDLASLPPIDSITADTDIRSFLAPGVPAELTRAALRRAWAADPRIRDFVGLEDYAWDFNAPESIPGFGKLEMTDELRREVARIVRNIAADSEPPASAAMPPGEPSEDKPKSAEAPIPDKLIAASTPPSNEPPSTTAEPADGSVRQPSADVATQQDRRVAEHVQPVARRGHGGALPK